MKRIVALFAVIATIGGVVGCSKPSEAPTSGPSLNPPAQHGAVIGQPGAAWANLEGTDGKKHSLGDLADAAVVAVVFTCNECPVAKAYEERLVQFASDYKDKGVEVVAINVNPGEAEDLAAMKQRAEKKEFSFAYLQDPSQEIARAYGATATPHVFVLDKGRNVVYMGAIDDNMDESDISKHFLRDSVDATLAGKAPEVTKTKAQGCSIRYE